MKKVLFLIHDLAQGGAEKVLVNLVNNMDYSKFDVTVMTLFDYGVNRQFLSSKVKYRTWCHKMMPGNSHLMKILSPEQLHRMIIKEKYDVEIAYLEGACARVISGCPNTDTKLVSWIHRTLRTEREAAVSFRNYKEAQKCYNRFNIIVYVSEGCKSAFLKNCPNNSKHVILYNTNDSEVIVEKAAEKLEINEKLSHSFNWCGVGKLSPLKAFDRLIRIQKKLLNEGYDTHLYVLGIGIQREELEKLSIELNVKDSVTFLGYQTNPYKFLSKMDLFVCSSHTEGFSTAATEALIVGTPVCTVEVSGMKEMLGKDNEYGFIVQNHEEALYQGIKKLVDNPELLAHYERQAQIRGKYFSKEKTVQAVEEMLIQI